MDQLSSNVTVTISYKALSLAYFYLTIYSRETNLKCDFNSAVVYPVLGCKPVGEDGKGCPIEYDCSHLKKLDQNKCYYEQKAYQSNNGDVIQFEDFPESLCSCVKFENVSAKWYCRMDYGKQCKRKDNETIILHEGCYEAGDENWCADVICPQPDKQPHTCEYQGRVYKERQPFLMDGKICLCTKEFNGTSNGPWCKNRGCDLRFNFNHLKLVNYPAPIPTHPLISCPFEFKYYHNETEYEIIRSESTTRLTESKCKFGPLELSVGDSVQLLNNIKCDCNIPPYVSCRPSEKKKEP